MNFKALAAATVAFFGAAGGASAMVLPIVNDGASFTTTTAGEYVTTYEGTDASFVSRLYLVTDDGIADNDILVFTSGSAVGSTFSLGNFAAGVEMVFRLFVETTANSFFSGAASRNPDDIIHAQVDLTTLPGVAIIGFEDILGGGDLDFNDFVFTVAAAPEIPVPGAAVLLLTGLAGAAGMRKLRKKTA